SGPWRQFPAGRVWPLAAPRWSFFGTLSGGRSMYRIACLLALATALAVGGAARASDPIGGYLIVDKVILAPADSPTTIQIWGSFVLAKEVGGRAYGNPECGYLYYKA